MPSGQLPPHSASAHHPQQVGRVGTPHATGRCVQPQHTLLFVAWRCQLGTHAPKLQCHANGNRLQTDHPFTLLHYPRTQSNTPLRTIHTQPPHSPSNASGEVAPQWLIDTQPSSSHLPLRAPRLLLTGRPRLYTAAPAAAPAQGWQADAYCCSEQASELSPEPQSWLPTAHAQAPHFTTATQHAPLTPARLNPALPGGQQRARG